MELSEKEKLGILNGLKESDESGMTPAFAYLRVSTEKQEDTGLSLDDQEAQCIAYAQRNKIKIIHIFRCSESARKKDRKVFNMMLRTSLDYHVKNLIIKSTDRMSRNYSDLVKMEELIDKSGYSIHFYSSNKVIHAGSTHYDRMMIGFEMVIAKGRSDEISQYGKESNKYKATNGIAPGPAPYGYKYDRKEKKHFIDQSVESTLRYIFDSYDNSNITLPVLADILNEKGYRSSRGQKWTKNGLWTLLTRTTYHGEFEYKGKMIKGNHEPYYSKQRYLKRLRKLEIGAPYKTRDSLIDYNFRGMVKCHCGHTMTGDLKKGRFLYYIHKCPLSKKQISIPDKTISSVFDAEMKRVSLSDKFYTDLKEIFRTVLQEKESSSEFERKAIASRISALNTKKQRFYDLFGEAGIDAAELREQITRINDQVKTLEESKMKLVENTDSMILRISNIIESIRNAPRVYQSSSENKKAAILREMIDFAIMEKSGSFAVQWKKPYSILFGQLDKFEFVSEWVNDETNFELSTKEFIIKTAVELAYSAA